MKINHSSATSGVARSNTSEIEVSDSFKQKQEQITKDVKQQLKESQQVNTDLQLKIKELREQMDHLKEGFTNQLKLNVEELKESKAQLQKVYSELEQKLHVRSEEVFELKSDGCFQCSSHI